MKTEIKPKWVWNDKTSGFYKQTGVDYFGIIVKLHGSRILESQPSKLVQIGQVVEDGQADGQNGPINVFFIFHIYKYPNAWKGSNNILIRYKDN